MSLQPFWGAALASALVAGSITGCAKKVAQEYFPIFVGATWEYDAEVSTQAPGKEKEVRRGTEICRCVGSEVIGGRDYFKVVTFFRGFPDEPEHVTWYRKAGDGIYRIDNKPENPEQLFLPLPPKPGHSWTVEDPKSKTVNSIEGPTTVDLPERSYEDCIKLRVEQSEPKHNTMGKQTFYFAPGIGGVKAELESRDFKLLLRLNKFSR